MVMLLGLVTGALFGTIVLLQREAQKNIEDIRFHPAALQQLKTTYEHLSTIDAFFAPGRSKDAGTILNSYIPLDGSSAPPNQTVWWNSLSKEEHDNIKKNWLEHPEQLSFPEDDVLAKLLEYDPNGENDLHFSVFGFHTVQCTVKNVS